jgi:hypothetical protein
MNSDAIVLPSTGVPVLVRARALPTASRGLSNAVALLLFAHFFLANSNLKVLQVGVELLLGATLIWMLYRCTLDWLELVLIMVYLLSVTLSCLFNGLVVGLLCAKMFGLAILCMLVFSKVRVDVTVTSWIVLANVLLIIYQSVFGGPAWFNFIVAHVGGVWREFTESRPLGLFMNAHGSASVTAVFFLSLGRRKLVSGLGFVLLLFSRSTYTLASYSFQLLQRLLAWLKIDAVVVPFVIVVALLVFLNAETVLNFELASLGVFSGREQGSFATIAGQLLSPDAYSKAFTLLPGDPSHLSDFVNSWANEVAYFTVLQQGGFVLGAFFLAMLLYRIKGFRVFMAVSMLHYGMALTPLMLFLLVHWSREIRERESPDVGQHLT